MNPKTPKPQNPIGICIELMLNLSDCKIIRVKWYTFVIIAVLQQIMPFVYFLIRFPLRLAMAATIILRAHSLRSSLVPFILLYQSEFTTASLDSSTATQSH